MANLNIGNSTANVKVTLNQNGDVHFRNGSLDFDSSSLPQFSETPSYLVGIESFANGGTLKWAEKASVSVGSADTAIKLQTARTIWGQSFDGTANISGNMTGVNNINTASAPAGTVYMGNWFRSTGSTGWYNESYGGGWYMTDNTYIRNYAGKATRLDNLCLGADNNSYRLYVNGTSYFNGNTTHNGIDYFANGTTYYINNSADANLRRGLFAGTSNADTAASNFYNSGAIEIRESGRVGSSQSSFNYAPRIGFHWSGRVAATLSFHNDGIFYLRKQNGSDRATLDANLNGNASTATKFATAQSITLTGDTTGTASSQAGWSIGTTTSKLSNAGHLDTAEKLDAFIEANKLKYATVAGVGGVASDGMIISVPWNNSWGHQIFLDDSAMVIQHRHRYSKTNSDGSTAQAWSGWATLVDSNNYTNYTVTKTGGGASGTWSISVTGSSASCTGNAATATKLATARTIRTNLASTSTASFDGSANITPGVTGVLPIANGGTGATTASTARDNLGAQSKVLYGPSAPSDSTGSNGDMYIALESGDFKKDIVNLIYPVGSIYISMNSTNPSTLFGGTWEAFGQGRVLIGAGTGNDGSTSLSFSAGDTGGSYKHTLKSSEIPSHSHSFSGTTSANNRSHTHSYTKATGVQGHTLTIAEMPSHTHNFTVPVSTVWHSNGGAAYQLDGVKEDTPTYNNYISSTGGGGSHSHGLSTSSTNSGSESQNHTHKFSGTTGSTGSGSSHNNIQPYIVVYMWKRTA